MDSWEEFDDEEAEQQAPVKVVSDKWEGEDEEDIVESWDALEDEDEEGDEEGSTDKPAGQVNGDVKAKPKRRSLAQIKAEKEAAKLKEEEERKKREEEMKSAPQPPELTAAQLQRIQEEADLELCKDTFGVFDSKDPGSKEDFERMGILIRDKLLKYQSSPHFNSCLETLFRDLALTIDVENLRKMSTMFSAMASEKQKQTQKTNANKKKAKGKVVVKMERKDDDIFGADSNAYVDDDYDDFM